jgi:hypothetical protein
MKKRLHTERAKEKNTEKHKRETGQLKNMAT